jgi:hypothetical protein
MAKGETVEKNRSRWYKCPVCGEDHPSVTTLLGVISSRALMNWFAKNGTAKLDVYHQSAAGQLPDETIKAIDKVAEERWKLMNETAFWKSGKLQGQEAADIGTMAHSWIEAHLHGKEVTVDSLPDGARRAVMAFLGWEKENKVEVLKTEQSFYNCRLRYAGTADCVAKVNGELTLLDWKTSSGIWMEMPLQLWGYALADESQNADRLYRQVAIGRFGKDGTPEVRIFKRNEFPGIEIARDVLTSCGHIFAAIQEWEKLNPYQPKPKKEKANDETTAPSKA